MLRAANLSSRLTAASTGSGIDTLSEPSPSASRIRDVVGKKRQKKGTLHG